MSRKNGEPGTFELLARLPQQIATLVRAEYENAKHEVFGALRKFGIGAIFVIIALFFLFWAIAALGTTVIAAINLALPLWASALIVAGILLLLTVASILAGVFLIKKGNPVPEETISRVTDDVIVASSVKYNAEHNLAAERAAAAGSSAPRGNRFRESR